MLKFILLNVSPSRPLHNFWTIYHFCDETLSPSSQAFHSYTFMQAPPVILGRVRKLRTTANRIILYSEVSHSTKIRIFNYKQESYNFCRWVPNLFEEHWIHNWNGNISIDVFLKARLKIQMCALLTHINAENMIVFVITNYNQHRWH